MHLSPTHLDESLAVVALSRTECSKSPSWSRGFSPGVQFQSPIARNSLFLWVAATVQV